MREYSRKDAEFAKTFANGDVCQKEYTTKAAEYARQAQLCVDWKDKNIFSKVFGTQM